jgi:hypothetical protein
MLTDVGQAGTKDGICTNADCYYVRPFFAKPFVEPNTFGEGFGTSLKVRPSLFIKINLS